MQYLFHNTRLQVVVEVVGVLDIDSPIFLRFDEQDKIGLEEFARIIEEEVF